MEGKEVERNEIISIINDKGQKEELEVIDDIKIEKDEYVIVSPIGSDVAFAYKTVIKNGEAEYISIGKGAEFEKVLAVYAQNQ